MRVVLIGASGLIGSHLLGELPGRQLLSLSRSAVLPPREGWREKQGGMEDWPALLEGEAVDVAIATIGTTWTKVRDWEKFEAIDRHAVVNFARAAKGAGARQLIVVSSAMANAESRNRYLAIKGWMEADVAGLGFDRVDIMQPGLLRGERGKERRIGERIGILASPLLNLLLQGPLDKYRAIDVALVAKAMAALVGREGSGVHVHRNREIRKLA